MSLLLGLFFAHVAALGFGLCGLLVVLPKVQTWAANTAAVPVLNFGMQYAGLVHIVFGAITMLATGMRCLGARRTALFFVVSVVVSLSYELLGTSTGWPFGAYSYTSGLGVRVFGTRASEHSAVMVLYGVRLLFACRCFSATSDSWGMAWMAGTAGYLAIGVLGHSS